MSGFLHRRRSKLSGPPERPANRLPSQHAPSEHAETDWRAYDSIAEIYERLSAPQTVPVARDLMVLAEPPTGGRVLDVGTGTGVGVAAAEEAGAFGVGVDMSLGMLAVGVRARPGLRLAAAAAIDLPFKDGTFDAVIANFVLSHFAKYDTALFDMLRVLKPGGRLAVSAWGPRADEYDRVWTEVAERHVEHELLVDARQRAMPWSDYFTEKPRLEQALRDAGLHPVRIEARQYRYEMSREDYVLQRETAATGRFIKDMLGPAWESFQNEVRDAFAERFPDPLVDFRDVLLAVGTKSA